MTQDNPPFNLHITSHVHFSYSVCTLILKGNILNTTNWALVSSSFKLAECPQTPSHTRRRPRPSFIDVSMFENIAFKYSELKKWIDPHLFYFKELSPASKRRYEDMSPGKKDALSKVCQFPYISHFCKAKDHDRKELCMYLKKKRQNMKKGQNAPGYVNCPSAWSVTVCTLVAGSHSAFTTWTTCFQKFWHSMNAKQK